MSTLKLHLDTDLGGDIDDLAALVMLLKWPGVEITGITTVAEEGGRRAGYVRHALRLAGRDDIPVAAGADVAGGHYRERPTYPPERAFWPEPVAFAPGHPDQALALLRHSIAQGAIVAGIGPCTNLALLDQRFPGILRRARVYLVGGFVYPPQPDRSTWGNELDYNFQIDVPSAHHVLARCNPTLVPLHVTVETAVRRAHVPVLRAAGPLGALLARQAEAFDAAGDIGQAHRERCPALPADFINHLYDALGCAVALGWNGAVVEELPLQVTIEDGRLRQRVAAGGTPTNVVTRVDGQAFDALWLEVVTS
jgi:inosine-uridine nucleoside N-ribohydrolase